MFESNRGLRVCRYDPSYKSAWDRHVDAGAGATFLFRRDFVEYHAHRFADHSLLVFDGDDLVAVLPASRRGADAVESHGGLTYGGIVGAAQAKLVPSIVGADRKLTHLPR